MVEPKFKKGDKVEIINYGHSIWLSKDGFIPKQMKLIYENDTKCVVDLNPELVGKLATIVESTITQGKHQYSLSGVSKSSWYNEDQLALVERLYPENSIDWEIELEKCKKSPYYFYTNYWLINGKKANTHLSEEQFNKIIKK